MQHGVLVTLAYDGAAFAGWQSQPGQRTVQDALAEAAARIAHHPVKVRGASRTDAGVHAEGQVAAFATDRALGARRWTLALNRYLPDDVAVRHVETCAPDYEPRFDALDKTYRYSFYLGVVRDPLLRGRVWHLGKLLQHDLEDRDRLDGARPRLDLDAMRRTAAVLEGTHDFRAFRSADDVRDNTTRTLHRVALAPGAGGDANVLALEVTGDAFLKNMVRVLAGTLIEVGRGRFTPEQVAASLGPEGERRQAGMTAPPHGLTLLRVRLGRSRARASR